MRGAKAIADKVDAGLIMLQPDDEDLIALERVIQEGGFPTPNVKVSIYKNRRGRYKDVLVWTDFDKGTCRMNPLFVTDYNYNLIDVPELQINVVEESAYESSVQ